MSFRRIFFEATILWPTGRVLISWFFCSRSIEKRAFGADAAAGAEVDADSVVDRMQYVAREKKRMMAANQAARIAYQARLIMATTAKEERARRLARTGSFPSGKHKMVLIRKKKVNF